MDPEIYTVHGVSGVDFELPIAGPGSRSYAFVIDWHIRILVALAWVAAGLYLVNGRLQWAPGAGKADPNAILFVLLPSLLIYFLYHPALELLMRGQSPGKRAAGLRVVTREGGIPGVGAILIRNVFRLLDSLPALYFVGLTSTLLSAQHVRVGDMAAGTLLVLDDRAAAERLLRRGGAAGPLDLESLNLVDELLERWPSLSADKRVAIAETLLARIAPGQTDQAGVLSEDLLRARLEALTRAPAA